MQVAAEVRRVLSKKPDKILLNHFKIKFSREAAEGSPISVEDATKKAKSRWGLALRAVGAKIVEGFVGKSEEQKEGE
jgi:hypothetical protein